MSAPDIAAAATERFDVRNRFTNAVQFTAEITCAPDATIGVKLGLAVRWARKARADLSGADLSRADLSGANLYGANLSGAKNHIPERTTALAALPYMTGLSNGAHGAFKLVNSRWEGHVQGGLKYAIGEVAEVTNADTNPANACAAGVNIADLPWCLREWREGYRILLVEHLPGDIACIPHGTDGKYRVHRCTPIRDITDELRANGVFGKVDAVEQAA